MAYKEGSIVEFDTGTFELKSGKWVPYTAPDLPGKPVEPPGMLDKLSRQAGLTVRYLAEGALGLPTMLADIPSKVAGMAGYDMPSASQGVQSLLSGLPQPQTPMERVVAGPSRALVGAGSTMGLGGLLGSGGQVTRNVGEALKAAPGGQAMGAIGGGFGTSGTAEAGLGPLWQAGAGILGGITAPAAGYKAARTPGVSRTAEALSLTPGAPKPTSRQAAEQMVSKAFDRDVLPEEAAQLAKYGPEARAIDIGGPNVRGLAQAVVGPPGKARTVSTKMLEDRSKASARRLINDAKKFAGADKEAFQTTKQIIQERKALSEPLYSAANKIEVDIDQSLKSLMQRPAMKKAYASALTKARNDVDWPAGIKIPSKVDVFKEAITTEQPKARLSLYGLKPQEKIQKATTISAGKVPLPMLDYVKRSLDDEIGAAIKNNKMDKARIFHGLKRELLGKLDSAHPEYKQAREIFSDRSSMLNAMETGKKILRADTDEMMEFVGDMTTSEKEMFVVGAMKSIRDKLKSQKIGGNAANKLATDLVRERIRPAFPDDDSFNSFVQGLERENVFMQSKGVLGGSPTQPRQATAKQLSEEAEGIINAPATGAFRAIRNFVFGEKQIPEKVRDEIAEILFIEQMASPGTFSNKTIARMRGYKIPKTKLNELANSLIQVQATQEQ